MDFNPRSHEGSDQIAPYARRQYYISIHAPMKGATTLVVGISQSLAISIHAPMKGATVVKTSLANFSGISIHAPMKGATHIL